MLARRNQCQLFLCAGDFQILINLLIFIALIARSLVMTEEHVRGSLRQTNSHGPFMRVYLPIVLSIRLWESKRAASASVRPM